MIRGDNVDYRVQNTRDDPDFDVHTAGYGVFPVSKDGHIGLWLGEWSDGMGLQQWTIAAAESHELAVQKLRHDKSADDPDFVEREWPFTLRLSDCIRDDELPALDEK